MHCQKKMRRPCSFINSHRQSLITSRTWASAKIKTDAHDTHTSFTQSRSKWGQNPEGNSSPGEGQGHTWVFAHRHILHAFPSKPNRNTKTNRFGIPDLDQTNPWSSYHWKTTKNGAYQQWWQLKLLIGLQGGWFSGLNEMNTAPHWTPIGLALLVPTFFIACCLSGQSAIRPPCGRAGPCIVSICKLMFLIQLDCFLQRERVGLIVICSNSMSCFWARSLIPYLWEKGWENWASMGPIVLLTFLQ